MTDRAQSLLLAAAQLLGANRDVAYGPAHAVRDALALEAEVQHQCSAHVEAAVPDLFRAAGAV